jgi:FixJ family two-component response regulator
MEDGQAALDFLAEATVDAIILDVAMPRIDGLEVARRLRVAGDGTPILMLTARDAVDDRVAGLDAGADDYLVKPFALRELHARLRALLRRLEAPMRHFENAELILDERDDHDVDVAPRARTDVYARGEVVAGALRGAAPRAPTALPVDARTHASHRPRVPPGPKISRRNPDSVRSPPGADSIGNSASTAPPKPPPTIRAPASLR